MVIPADLVVPLGPFVPNKPPLYVDATTGRVFLGDYVAGNYTEVSPGGELIAHGEATYWDDFRFPASRLQVNPALLKPDFDFANVGLLFDAASTETVFCIAQMPHGWKEGSDIRPHIHWQPTNTNTGNVLWKLEYKWANVGDVDPALWSEVTVLATGAGVAGTNQIAAFPALSGVGKTLSSLLSMKVSRIGGDGTDTYDVDARMKEFDLHYQIDMAGSREPFSK